MVRAARLAAVVAVVLAAVPLRAQRGPAIAELRPVVETEQTAPGSDVRAALQVRLPEGYHTNSNKPRDPNYIPLTLTVGALPDGVTAKEVVFPEAVDLTQQGVDQPLRVFDGEFVIGAVFGLSRDVPAGTVRIPAVLRYQACDEVACYLPVRLPVEWVVTIGKSTTRKTHAEIFSPILFGQGEPPSMAAEKTAAVPVPATTRPATGTTDDVAALEPFVEMGSTTGYLGTEDFLTFIRNAENGVKERGMFEGRGPLAILLLVLLGGLALNLTPCVLPMIPINLAIIGAGAQAGTRGRGFLLGAAYGAAMAAVYGVLGLVVVLTTSTFGTINASPWFNVGIAVLFVVLALAMFDVLVIDFSGFSNRVQLGSNRGSFLVAFGMGGVAALLAGACVAPVVIQVVLFSSNLYAAGTRLALALPFLLGVGMAIPWPIAGAGIAALPRPGAWMVRVKQVFGVLILATAVNYGYQGYRLFANRWVDASEVSASVAEKLKSGWHASMADGLAVALRENKPVLVDMWATWCKDCLVMDRTTLEDPAVKAALDNYVKVKFEAQDPDDPRVGRVMQKLGARGLPTYVILKAK